LREAQAARDDCAQECRDPVRERERDNPLVEERRPEVDRGPTKLEFEDTKRNRRFPNSNDVSPNSIASCRTRIGHSPVVHLTVRNAKTTLRRSFVTKLASKATRFRS
jgi:hypothetical protein